MAEALTENGRVVVFDAMGTLFDLSALDQRFEAAGGTSATRDAWFERLLDTSKALTLVGAFEPFQKLAAATLRATLASHRLDPASADEILAGLADLPAYPEAREALSWMADAALPVVLLTNGGRSQTKALLETAGLDQHVQHVFAAEEVEAFKPDARPYRHVCEKLGIAPTQAVLVAAHAWDILGAQAVGYDAIWVDRTELCWPIPDRQPPRRAGDLEDVARQLTFEAR